MNRNAKVLEQAAAKRFHAMREGMTSDALSFEFVTCLHLAAEPERQQAGLRAWEAALTRRGLEQAAPEEPWSNLKEISKATRKHVVWLAKLQVPERCGERLAGRRSYKLSMVLDYLKSQACRERIAELHKERKMREQAKDVEGKAL